ncbi:sulfite exporter TauE/SafE family protein [Actinosynnema sp. NPDC047251]|uniref:sulfite exporter TauE/SafE family protein n=1 Tax=Saccharothrix espanaensis TaxID=103731 RepID=UPI00059EB6B0|nr:sulfite exporter TauE/SafE family protein [Saccharothrix espanaensis]
MFPALLGIGLLTGLTTVVFGFGGGFVTVPVIVWADAHLGGDAARVAVATSAVVMVVNAAIATASTRRDVLRALRGRHALIGLLAVGAAAGAIAARYAPADLLRWAFVGYLVGTIADLPARPGFLRPATGPAGPGSGVIRSALGVPIGAVAAFLGVGGSVLTVPLLRRGGHPMRTATALANPLTLAIAVPSTAVFLIAGGTPGTGADHLVGLVDVTAAAALLAGAVPVILALKLRPPRIPDRAYAHVYLGLLVVVTAAMAVSNLAGG